VHKLRIGKYYNCGCVGLYFYRCSETENKLHPSEAKSIIHKIRVRPATCGQILNFNNKMEQKASFLVE